MIISLTASADTYITNKIIDNRYQTGSNVGQAGTLDLFTIYDKSNIVNSYEKSRILINFDIERVKKMCASTIDIEKIDAILNLKNLNIGNATPSNFTISCFPLAKSFREGNGRDVISFTDYDFSNYISSSLNSEWSISGCDAHDIVGTPDIDYYDSIDYGSGPISLECSQTFENGTEDLYVNVTNIIKAYVNDDIDSNGFRISFSNVEDNDQKTKFVKRFGSRHTKNASLRPQLIIKFDDSKIDNRDCLFFDELSTLRLDGHGNNLKNIDGSSVEGNDCIFVSLTTGSYKTVFTGSQEFISDFISGSYVVPVIVQTNDTAIVSGTSTLSQHILASGSITFEEKWHDPLESKMFYTGSIKINSNKVFTSTFDRCKLISRCEGPTLLDKDEFFRLRVNFYDISLYENSSKFNQQRESLKILNGHYRFRDLESGKLIFDFEDCTTLSLDSIGNYANISSSIFQQGRTYTPEFKINYLGDYRIISDKNFILKVRT